MGREPTLRQPADLHTASAQPSWPLPPAAAVLVATQASSPVEADLLDRWVARQSAECTAAVTTVRVPHPKADDLGPVAAALRTYLDDADDTVVLLPVRVVWRPEDEATDRVVPLLATLVLGDPRHPRARVQDWIRRRQPDRARVVLGEQSTILELRQAWMKSRGAEGTGDEFARFAARRMTLALEREESHLLGPQYKVPKLVREEVATSVRFREGIAELSRRLGRDGAEVTREAEACLDEMAAGFSRLQLDHTLRMGRLMYRQGYDEQLDYDPGQVDRVRDALRRHSGVILPTHRSNLDASVLPVAFHELGLPPTHTLGGINMAFWPVGAISRRAGVIFIRRDTTGNPIYRFVLRQYIGYLTEKRFHLEWYIEGGRSRTGKLLPPRMGLLTYVVDAYREGRTEDVVLVPTSITYDQLREVSEYAGEARGATKQAEGLGWLVRYLRSLRGRYGKIYIRFGEPLSLREVLGPPEAIEGTEERSLALQKAAFEVCRRINKATPVTATALVSLTLLAAMEHALTLDQVRLAVREPLAFAVRHGVPLAESARRLDAKGGVQSALDELVHHHVVSRFDEGFEPVYSIRAEERLTAAFYRNTIVHIFLDRALAELALVRAAESAVADPVAAFWEAATALRDLLKFDFFFAEKDEFCAELAGELARHDPGWETRLNHGPDAVNLLLAELEPLTAHTTLRPFLEGYYVVALALRRQPDGEVDRRSFFSLCEGLGRQLLLQQRIRGAESLSRLVFEPGLRLAENRGLLGSGDDLAAKRSAFATELRDHLRRIDLVEDTGRRWFLDALAQAPG